MILKLEKIMALYLGQSSQVPLILDANQKTVSFTTNN